MATEAAPTAPTAPPAPPLTALTASTTADVKSLEQRYISLLEEKIAHLEKELAAAQDAMAMPPPPPPPAPPPPIDTTGTGVTAPDSLSGDVPPPTPALARSGTTIGSSKPSEKRHPRVRIITRQFDELGDFVEVDEPEVPLPPKPASDTPARSYAIAWRRIFSYVRPGTGSQYRPSSHENELLIESHDLRSALTDVVSRRYPHMTFETDEVVLARPYDCIIHCRDELEQYAKTAPEQVAVDIRVLVDEVFAEMDAEIAEARRLVAKRMITFGLLWFIFSPQRHVYCKLIMDEPQLFLVNQLVIEGSRDTPLSSEHSYTIWAYGMEHNGKKFERVDTKFVIKQFEGTKPISSLWVHPLEHHLEEEEKDEDGDGDADGDDKGGRDIETLKQHLLARGRAFEKLVTAPRGRGNFMYAGPVVDEGRDQLPVNDDAVSRYGDGRVPAKSISPKEDLAPGTHVVVDTDSFLQYSGKPLTVGKNEYAWATACGCWSCLLPGKDNWDGFHPAHPKATHRKLREQQLLLCPPRVLGFAVKEKIWVQMLVTGISPIETSGKAFQSLELADKTKTLLKHLVEQHTKKGRVRINDLIPGKGNGLIVLLHGPPGVGKTLTAESVSMLTGRPLYSISMSDVGLSPTVVETNLLRIFDLAVRWEAILLFDEADVFLETRTLADLQRNGLVSMLLRVLEYYHGILFLTTNRVKTFDEAFQSRVHIAIKYEELTFDQRRRIWKMWLAQVNDELAREDDEDVAEQIDNLSHEQFNGRQIRNIVMSAQAMAAGRRGGGRGSGEVQWMDIDKVVKVTRDFQNYLNKSSELAKQLNLR